MENLIKPTLIFYLFISMLLPCNSQCPFPPTIGLLEYAPDTNQGNFSLWLYIKPGTQNELLFSWGEHAKIYYEYNEQRIRVDWSLEYCSSWIWTFGWSCTGRSEASHSLYSDNSSVIPGKWYWISSKFISDTDNTYYQLKLNDSTYNEETIDHDDAKFFTDRIASPSSTNFSFYNDFSQSYSSSTLSNQPTSTKDNCKISLELVKATCSSYNISAKIQDATGSNISAYTGTIDFQMRNIDDTPFSNENWEIQVNNAYQPLTHITSNSISETNSINNENGIINLKFSSQSSSNIELTAFSKQYTNIFDNTTVGVIDNSSTHVIYFSNTPLTSSPSEMPSIPPIVSGKDNNDIYLTVMNRGSCNNESIDYSFAGVKPIEFKTKYIDPELPEKISVLNTEPDTNILSSPPPPIEISTNSSMSPDPTPLIPVNFINGSANIGISYHEIGKLRLSAKFSDGNYSFSSESADIIFYPKDLEIISVQNESGNSILINSDSDFDPNTPYIKQAESGEALSVKIIAKNNDGQILNYFGRASSKETPKLNSTLASNIPCPADANCNPLIDTSTSNYNYPTSNSGTGFIELSNVFWNGIGTTKLSGSLNSYFGYSTSTYSPDILIGRFAPSYFKLAVSKKPKFRHSCTDIFTYFSQPILYYDTDRLEINIIPMSARDISLGGYIGPWNFLFTNSTSPTKNFLEQNISRDHYSSQLSAFNKFYLQGTQLKTLSSITDSSPIFSTLSDGSLLFKQNSLLQLAYPKQNLPKSPKSGLISFQLSIYDSDGISTKNSSEFIISDLIFPLGGEFRDGRAILRNTAGPYYRPMSVPIEFEYFDGTTWVSNISDNCTTPNLIESETSEITGMFFKSSTSINGHSNVLVATNNNIGNLSTIGTAIIKLHPNQQLFLNFDLNHDGYIYLPINSYILDKNDTNEINLYFGKSLSPRKNNIFYLN